MSGGQRRPERVHARLVEAVSGQERHCHHKLREITGGSGKELGRRWRVAIGGKAALADDVLGVDLLALPGDPVEEADRVSALLQAAR